MEIIDSTDFLKNLFLVWFNPTLTVLKLVNTIATTNITIGDIKIKF